MLNGSAKRIVLPMASVRDIPTITGDKQSEVASWD